MPKQRGLLLQPRSAQFQRIGSLARSLARLRQLDSVEMLQRRGVMEARRFGESSSATLWELDVTSPGGGREVLCHSGRGRQWRRRHRTKIRTLMASIVLADPEALADLRAGDVIVLREPASADPSFAGDDRWPTSAFALVEGGQSTISVLQIEIIDASGPADTDLPAEALALFAAEWGHMLQAARTSERLRVRLERATELIEAIGGPRDATVADALEPTGSTGDANVSGVHRSVAAPELGALTPREVDVFELMLEGASNATIAETLFISLATVKSHVKSILSKLGLATRLQVVARYRDIRPGELRQHA